MMDNDLKKQIDEMSHYEMCRVWRFAETENPLLQGNVGEYFTERLFHYYGGFTPEISKSLGWDNNYA